MENNPIKWGNDAPPLSAGALDDLYEFYNRLPDRVDSGKVNKKDFQPSKSTLKGFLRETTFVEAMVELVDNAIDNFVESRSEGYPIGTMDFKVLIKKPESGSGFPNGAIVVRENSGGVPPSKRIALIRLGQTTREGSQSIGTWGWGAKLAYHTLGCNIEIFTRHWKLDEPKSYWYPSDWLDEPRPEPKDPDQWTGSWYNWAPNECEISPEGFRNIEKGETVTVVHLPNKKIFDKGINVAIRQLNDMLGIAFAEKENELRTQIGAAPLRITIRSETDEIVTFRETVEQQVINNCAFFPTLEPIKVNCKWALENGEELEGEIYVGISAEGETEIPDATRKKNDRWKSQGIYMWGNGRPFLEHISGVPEGSHTFVYTNKFSLAELPDPKGKGADYNFKFQKPRIDRGNLLHIWIKFRSKNSQSIPWNSPRKMRFASIGNDFEKDVWDISVGYANLSNKIKRDFIKPFTQNWNSLGEDEKIRLIFPERLIDKSGYAITGSSYDEKVESLKSTSARNLASYQVRPKILSMPIESFRILRTYGLVPSRSNRYVNEIINRTIAIENPECTNATLKAFWEPLLGGEMQ